MIAEEWTAQVTSEPPEGPSWRCLLHRPNAGKGESRAQQGGAAPLGSVALDAHSVQCPALCQEEDPSHGFGGQQGCRGVRHGGSARLGKGRGEEEQNTTKSPVKALF